MKNGNEVGRGNQRFIFGAVFGTESALIGLFRKSVYLRLRIIICAQSHESSGRLGRKGSPDGV